MKAAREAVWWMWEQPRLPRPLIRSKYPTSYPWSAAAREAHARGERGLVLEHLIPATITMRRAVENAEKLDPAGLVTLLQEHGGAVVITTAEDRLLSTAGLARSMPDGWDGVDVWARHREAGLAPHQFTQFG